MPVCNCIGIDQWVQIFMIKVVLEPVTFLSSANMRIGRFYGRMTRDEAKDIREDFKYYFADFVRKGVPPRPFTDKIFAKKKVTDLGGTPLPPPLRTFPRKMFFKKC